MNLDADELSSCSGLRARTFSNASQQSQQSSKHIFPLMASDSGLYTCSSNTSDCSLQLESDTECSYQSSIAKGVKDERLRLALHDVRKLRSELERLTKSEQWYKQELKQQKSTRLDDLERIYSQERKFMQENQRLQKECVRLYEHCNELERELEKQTRESDSFHAVHLDDEDNVEANVLVFEKEQQLALIKDQQQLISVLRKQKRSLLEDLRCLTEEKDEKVMELQRLLANLEFDNKLITKKCSQFAKERLNLEENLKQSDNKLLMVLQEKMNLQKSIVDLKEQLDIQRQLLNIKEGEIEHIQQHYTHKIENEQDLDQVHDLSIKYQEEINAKTLDIISLKQRLQEMEDELEEMKDLQQQNELQQRQLDQLNFSLEACRLELQELKTSEELKNKQLDDLHTTMDQLVKDKELAYKKTVDQQNDLARVKEALKSTQEQYEKVQKLYKNTQLELELLEVEQGKVKFENDRDRQEIEHLRKKLKEYLQQTTELSNKIQNLENELDRVLKENCELKQNYEHMKNFVKELEEKIREEGVLKRSSEQFQQKRTDREELYFEDQDFLELQQKCEKLQKNIDIMKDSELNLKNDQVLLTINDLMNNDSKVEEDSAETNIDFVNLSMQGNKLQENLDKMSTFLREKQYLLQNSNDSIEKLVTENKILKQKLCAMEREALTLQIKENINDRTQKYTEMKESLEIHKAKVASLQENLLINDAKLYKMEKKLRTVEGADEKLKELHEENAKLNEHLRQEQTNKAELNQKLLQETQKLQDLKQSLEELKMKGRSTKNEATQCSLTEDTVTESLEVKELKQKVFQLQQEQRIFEEKESYKKEERLLLLHQMMELQNNKIQNLRKYQEDWEDVLNSLNDAQALEEKSRKELELKRMELEELNQVFADQNEELRKLEEFTTVLEVKRQQEKEQMKLTFQQEINVMKQQLHDCKNEIEQLKHVNQQLEIRNSRFQQDINEDFATEVAEYKNEMRELKSRISKLVEEKEDLLEYLKELENQAKVLRDSKREAILMPDFNLVKVMDISAQTSVENGNMTQQNISEDHLRILTKVLEAEYQRKMLRYDDHIHSLLSNLKSLKKSLKSNEEKTALLSEEQLKTKEELKDLQNTKRSLEEMRLKYEQSQNTIKELKDTLAFERKKFELSDLGKSSQNNGTTYEVSNLIDDYKKLIQQSSIVTKRPSTSAILDLIQRSNQCVPNLQHLETNVEGLRSELQNFLTCYNHKIAASSLIATASLSVPPSLMDELRAVSEGF